MTTSNRVSVTVPDNTVYLDNITMINLDLSGCGIPEDVYAINFKDGVGDIEYKNHYKFNDTVNVLPDWASNCASICELAYAARQK